MTDGNDFRYTLDGIGETEFNQWKHHPASKVFFRFLRHYAQRLRALQVEHLEHSESALEPKQQGEFKGRINTLTEVASIEFADLMKFYPGEHEEEGSDAA
jgi:hypothetical protein